MEPSVLVGLLSLLGTLAGKFGGILTGSRLTNYRLAQLEEKVARHNNLIERTYKIEETLALYGQKIETLERRRDT